MGQIGAAQIVLTRVVQTGGGRTHKSGSSELFSWKWPSGRNPNHWPAPDAILSLVGQPKRKPHRARVFEVMLTAGLLLAACSSSTGPVAGRPGGGNSRSSTSNLPSTPHSHSSTSNSEVSRPTLPVARATGALEIYAQVPLALPAASQVTAAESPDGAVFVAQESNDPKVSSLVWVVDGDGPPAVAEHVTQGVTALAADLNNLYVASETTVFAFSRSTGDQVGHWALPQFSTANTSDADLVSMSAHQGTALVMLPLGSGAGVYRIRSASTAPPQLVARGSSAVFGPDGSVFFGRSDGHLVELSSTGASTVGPELLNAPNGLGGGVQEVVAVAGGLVWVSQPAGQGLDTQFSTYGVESLQRLGSYPGSISEQIVDTSAGALVLGSPEASANCPQPSASLSTSCVFRISSAAVLTDPTPVGSALLVIGPDPAVITTNASNSDLQLDRLS
jgi:hypothetical protein